MDLDAIRIASGIRLGAEWKVLDVDTVASSYLHLTSKIPAAVANQVCTRK